MKTDDFLSLHKSTGDCSCVYFLKDKGDIVYIGSTNYPHQRVKAHTNSDKVFDDVSIMSCSNDEEKVSLERNLIRKHLPLYNKLVLKECSTFNKTTIQLHLLTGKKLKEISDKRKANAEYPSKQTEILTEYINKLHAKECK